jgi:DNA-binding CsgD family transcriptional regulator
MTQTGPTPPHIPTPGPQGTVPLAAPALLWETMTTEPGVSVAILDEQGTILFLNAETIRIFFNNNPPDPVRGKRLDQLGFPRPWVEERLALFRQMKEDPRPRLMRTVWHGHQQFSWVRMVPPETAGEIPTFMVITRRVPAGQESERLLQAERGVIESGVIRLGELDVLTPRELEVLTLLGNGLSIKDIAENLGRSVKTVERHRESIGAKLRLSKAVVLADLAREAGLVLGDSARRRV